MRNSIATPISFGREVENGVEEAYGFFYLTIKVTAVCSCGWRGNTHSRLNLFSYYESTHKLALEEYFLHEKTH